MRKRGKVTIILNEIAKVRRAFLFQRKFMHSVSIHKSTMFSRVANCILSQNHTEF